MEHRTNIVLDTTFIISLKKATGQETIRAALETAGKFFIQENKRIKKMQGIRKYMGSGIWDGNLKEMRKDRFPHVIL